MAATCPHGWSDTEPCDLPAGHGGTVHAHDDGTPAFALVLGAVLAGDIARARAAIAAAKEDHDDAIDRWAANLDRIRVPVATVHAADVIALDTTIASRGSWPAIHPGSPVEVLTIDPVLATDTVVLMVAEPTDRRGRVRELRLDAGTPARIIATPHPVGGS